MPTGADTATTCTREHLVVSCNSRMTDRPINLSYGTERPRRWGVYARRAVLFGITLVAALAASRYIPRYFDRWRTFDAQEAARRYVSTNDFVIATAGESKLDHGAKFRGSGRLFPVAEHRQWSAFGAKLIRPNTHLVYLGFHKSPSGNQRIIAVAASNSFGMESGDTYFGCDVWVYSEGTRMSSPKVETLTLDFVVGIAGKEIQVLSGKPDSVDAARFQIPIKGERGVVVLDGTLYDDDTVKLLIRE